MANGRLDKETGYCDYEFLDKTYCKEHIERIVIQENGKQSKKNRWEDKKKRNFCIYHSHNDEKNALFYEKLNMQISIKNDNVKQSLRMLDSRGFSEEKREKGEILIRNEHLLDFEGFYFPKDAEFKERTFESSVFFHCCEFNGEANFNGANFHGEIDFSDVKFDKAAIFNNSKFEKETKFTVKIFKGIASFKKTEFIGKVFFSNITFGEETHFILAKFGNVTRFHGSTFDKKVIFDLATFNREVYFIGTTFSDDSLFNSTKFEDIASFDSAKFKGMAFFRKAVFEEKVTFNSSLFYKRTDFAHTAFLKTLDFTDALFLKGELDFTRTHFPIEETFFHNTVFNCEVLFHEQMLKGVRFTGCYLGSGSFYGSDIRDAVFINSSWNRRFLEKQILKLKKEKRVKGQIPILDVSNTPPRSKRRAILFDEKIYKASKDENAYKKFMILISSCIFSFFENIKRNLTSVFKNKNKPQFTYYNLIPSKLELDPLYLEHLYCQFKLAMDSNKMFGLANDFYHGEKLMETKRLCEERSFWSFLKWAFLWLYRLLAGFGNRPVCAILNFIGVITLVSLLLVCCNGVQPITRNPDVYKYQNLMSSVKTKGIDAGISSEASSRDKLNGFINILRFPTPYLPTAIEWSFFTGEFTITKLKKEASANLRKNFWDSWYYVTMWNIASTPALQSGDFKASESKFAHFCIFLIQWIFRPLMITLVIISIRRKVHRG